MAAARTLLIDGLSDAVCFLLGAGLGYGLGQWLGFDLFTQGYGTQGVIGILLVGLCGGAGLHLRHIWRARQAGARSVPDERPD